MACPFFRRSDLLSRQPSVCAEASNNTWQLEDEEQTGDALTLTHLQMAIQLLTAPSVSENINANIYIFTISIILLVI